jgi:UDP-N-acetylglucosamine 1-carboxyvinyltransferase
VIFLGAILARAGEAVLSMPGGCELGPRPIDLHLSALRALGAEISEENGNIVCKGRRLTGCRIDLPIPSVGATENSMLASSRCRGTTVITNAAREPEIWDLQRYLNKIGAKVRGAGSSIITVEGSDFGCSAEHKVIPDRIVAATYLCCAAIAGGRMKVTGVIPRHLETVTDALCEMGCVVIPGDNDIYIRAEDKLKALKPVITRPYPGFPTDAQPPLMAACLKAEGTTAFVENIFRNRYRHVGELRRMGADIRVEDRIAMVSGVKSLSAAPVTSTDLRGGAALVVAALGAEGTSEISKLHHIDRGYEKIEEALASVGADIVRTENTQ